MYESSFTITPAVENAMETGKQQVEQLVKSGAQAATEGYEGFVSFTKQNVEAVVNSGATLAKGAESMAKSWFAFGQKSFEGSLGVAKDAIACRNFKDFVELQTKFARDQFDSLFGEATRQSELGVKAAQEAFSPISERINVAVEKVLKPTA